MENRIQITNEDNMALMARYPDNYFDLAIVDPPYGGNDAIGLKDNAGGNKQATKRTKYNVFENIAPNKEYFEELKRVSKHQIIWGVNFYNNYDLSGGRICWDKKGTAFGRAELAYYSGSKSVNVVEIEWNGMIQHDMKNKEVRIHPTQKPVKLYEWLLMNYAKEGDKILDTHLGSGSIAIACDNLGFDLTAQATAIEAVKTYKVYTAVISQEGTDAPFEEGVLENTLGGGVTYARVLAGQYTITMPITAAFGKTRLMVMGYGNPQHKIVSISNSGNTLSFSAWNNSNNNADDLIEYDCIEIRVYN